MKYCITAVIIILTILIVLSISNGVEARGRRSRYTYPRTRYVAPNYYWGTAYIERSKGYRQNKQYWGTAILERSRRW
jgi:hypothetical protein